MTYKTKRAIANAVADAVGWVLAVAWVWFIAWLFKPDMDSGEVWFFATLFAATTMNIEKGRK